MVSAIILYFHFDDTNFLISITDTNFPIINSSYTSQSILILIHQLFHNSNLSYSINLLILIVNTNLLIVNSNY